MLFMIKMSLINLERILTYPDSVSNVWILKFKHLTN